MKTIIAGSRGLSGVWLVAKAVAASGWLMQITEVVEGEAPGIDRSARQWAYDNRIKFKAFDAHWRDFSGKDGMPVVIRYNRFGKKYNAVAGHNRNQRMAEYAEALIAIWDGESTGTKDMIDRAINQGLKVYIYKVEKPNA